MRMKVLWWLNKKTERWIKRNVCFENWQLLDSGVAIDYRYIEDIVRGLLDNGFVPNTDFEI